MSSPYGPGPYGQPYGYGPLRQPHPQGVTILVFGILGFVVCFGFGIAAWVMGNKALAEVDAHPGAYDNRGLISAGRILGIVGTLLNAAGVVLMIIYLVVIIGIFASQSSYQ